MTALESNLKGITCLLDQQGIPYMVIGGIANLIWGRARLTRDLDISILCRDDALPGLLQALRQQHYRVLPADPGSFVAETRVLPVLGREEVRIDIVVARLPYEEAAIRRAREVMFDDVKIKVCTAEDLIIHKIISERTIDLEDVRDVIKRQRSRLNRDYLDPIVKELSRFLEQPDIWEYYLSCLAGQR